MKTKVGGALQGSTSVRDKKTTGEKLEESLLATGLARLVHEEFKWVVAGDLASRPL
jgi:hypothetical protein